MDDKKDKTRILLEQLLNEVLKEQAKETGRPKIENYFPENMTVEMINNTFLENIELYNYINALDQYIDELESKSV